MSETTSLRERTRRAVAAEITAAAIDLFSVQGFEATTVDQIAAAAGMSRRSFFRYFSSKDEVLLQSLDATGHDLASTLVGRPAVEEPWTALRRSFDGLVDTVDDDPERSAALLDMLLGSPALHGAHLAKQAAWQKLLAAALLARAGQTPDSTDASAQLRAAALAGAALACLEAAQIAWLQNHREALPVPPAGDLASVLDHAMGSIHSLVT